MINKNYLAIFIAVIPFTILGVAIYYAFQYPEPVVFLGAPSANLTRDVAPIFNSTSTDATYGNFSVGSSTALYFGFHARYGSTTALSASSGTATTTISSATSTFAGGLFAQQGIQFDDLVSCDTINTDASGFLVCGNDAGGTTIPDVVLAVIGGTTYLRASTTANAWYFNNGFVSAASSTITGALNITGGNINFGGDSLSDFVGTGLQVTSGALTLNATGDWTGTLDTLEAAAFLRSDASDNYTSGTLTFDSGTTLTMAAGSTFGSSITGTSTWSGGISAARFLATGGLEVSGGGLIVPASFGGRSLTVAGGSLDADSELFTRGITYNVGSTTGIGTSTDEQSFQFQVNSTLTEVNCYDDAGIAEIQVERRTSASPMASSTFMLQSFLTCDMDTASTTSFHADLAGAVNAGHSLHLRIERRFATSSRPTRLRVNVRYTIND